MNDWVYSCDRAARSLVELVRLLSQVGVLAPPPSPGAIQNCVRQCTQCLRDPRIKRCTGWTTTVSRGMLSFRPAERPGQPRIRLDLSAECSFQRSTPARSDGWEKQPLGSSTATLEIVEVETEALLERFHVDLANRDQAGSVWHLQYGGNPAHGGMEPVPTAWLDEPRWPSFPADLALLAELVTYNFFPQEWEELNTSGEWVRLILGVERLVLTHFAQHVANHFGVEPERRNRTWLAAQDNLLSEFDPRP